jgi:hypothetical protein
VTAAPARHVPQRLTAQLLAGPPARDPVAVAQRILAIQAQDLRGAQLAIRARTDGLSVADVDRALTDDRTLLITTLNRGTLHLVRREDYGWLHALTAPTVVSSNARRLEQEGISPRDAERGLQVIGGALAGDGPLTRRQLRDRLDAAGVPTAGQALVHLLLLAALRGLTVRGPMIDGDHAFVLVRDWIGEPDPVDRDAALAELARRFLAGHGPAGDRDLARWAGLPLRDVRAGLQAIAPELVQLDDGLVDLAGRAPAAELPAPQLLGTFEPLLMGWVSREPILGEHRKLVTVNGIFRPLVLVGGHTVGTWRWRNGAATIAFFDRVTARDAQRLDTDAADVARFLRR